MTVLEHLKYSKGFKAGQPELAVINLVVNLVMLHFDFDLTRKVTICQVWIGIMALEDYSG
jgi:hypothetical protein